MTGGLTAPVPAGTRRFDRQGRGFDRRAGLPPGVGREVARAILALIPEPGPVLEVGAGTGEIGADLVSLAGRYVGIDVSPAMLVVFQAKAGDPATAPVPLVQADANRAWPVRSRSVAAVFASRVAHLLDTAHLLAEVPRVSRRGGVLVVGRVVSDADSVRARLRRRRRELLQERGIIIDDGAERTRDTLAAFAARGARLLEPRTVSTWTRSTSPDQVLAGWAEVGAVGGVEVDPATHAAVLEELRAWAAREVRNPARPAPCSMAYTLAAVVLP